MTDRCPDCGQELPALWGDHPDGPCGRSWSMVYPCAWAAVSCETPERCNMDGCVRVRQRAVGR